MVNFPKVEVELVEATIEAAFAIARYGSSISIEDEEMKQRGCTRISFGCGMVGAADDGRFMLPKVQKNPE